MALVWQRSRRDGSGPELVRRNLTGLCVRIKLDDGCDCALLIVKDYINVGDCHTL